MKELTVRVEKVNEVLVTTSNRVAEELGVEHKNLLVKIDSYDIVNNSWQISSKGLKDYAALFRAS